MKFEISQKSITSKDTMSTAGHLPYFILEVLVQIPIPFIAFNGFFIRKNKKYLFFF